jgi:putative transposase
MSPRLSSVIDPVPFEVRPRQRFGSAPGLRLLTGSGAEERLPPYRLRASRRRPAPIPLLPVAYRGSYLRRLLAPRRPVERALLSVIQQTYLAGGSTRSVDALAETVGVPGTDPAMVEAQAMEWDQRVDAFRNRPLQEDYHYLMLIETPALVREAGETQPCQVVVAIGITESGNRDVVGLTIRGAEPAATFWASFLTDLKSRGLQSLQVITTDRIDGLLPAMAAVLPGVHWQRCRERFLTEALHSVPRDARASVETAVRAVFAQPDTKSALEALSRVRAQYAYAFPELVAALEAPVGALLTYYQVEPSQRRLVSSLSALAPLQRELRQACQLVGIFPHRRALLRLAGTVLQEISDEWAARRHHHARRPRAAAAVSVGSALARAWAA